jgi:hypothetical protein
MKGTSCQQRAEEPPQGADAKGFFGFGHAGSHLAERPEFLAVVFLCITLTTLALIALANPKLPVEARLVSVSNSSASRSKFATIEFHRLDPRARFTTNLLFQCRVGRAWRSPALFRDSVDDDFLRRGARERLVFQIPDGAADHADCHG